MPLNITHLSQLLDPAFDTVIDVRSPAEYDEDHLPGAINLPALSNDETRTDRHDLQAGRPLRGAQGRCGTGGKERGPPP